VLGYDAHASTAIVARDWDEPSRLLRRHSTVFEVLLVGADVPWAGVGSCFAVDVLAECFFGCL